MSKQQPFLPLFFGDFLASTALWEGEEQALYLLLLGYQWSAGSLPADTKRLCRMARYDAKEFARLWKVVGTKFVEIDGKFFNERLEDHRSKTRQLQKKNSDAGRSGADSKWGSGNDEKASDETPGETRSERLAAARRLATHSAGEWVALMMACGNQCVKCSAQVALCKDHIVPIYQGGSDGLENLQPMCRSCNSAKGPDRTDYRPNGWRERLQNAWPTPGNPIRSDPIRSDPSEELSLTAPHLESSHRQLSLSARAKPKRAVDKKSLLNGHAEAFAQVQAAYPKRAGGQRWQDAAHAYNARLEEGATHEEILAGVERYARHIRAKGDEGTQFVQQAATFLGTNRQYLQPWNAAPTKADQRLNTNLSAAAEFMRRTEKAS